jgi:hypothetical protein
LNPKRIFSPREKITPRRIIAYKTIHSPRRVASRDIGTSERIITPWIITDPRGSSVRNIGILKRIIRGIPKRIITSNIRHTTKRMAASRDIKPLGNIVSHIMTRSS